MPLDPAIRPTRVTNHVSPFFQGGDGAIQTSAHPPEMLLLLSFKHPETSQHEDVGREKPLDIAEGHDDDKAEQDHQPGQVDASLFLRV